MIWRADSSATPAWVALALVLGSTFGCRRSTPSHDTHEAPAANSADPAHAHEREEHGHESLPEHVTVSADVVLKAGIKLERASKQPLSETLDLPGEVGADPDKLARLSSPAADCGLMIDDCGLLRLRIVE